MNKEIKFRYSNSANVNLLYLLFGVFLVLLLLLIANITNDFSIWIVEKFSIIGLIFIIIFALIFVIVFMTFPYYLSLKVNDKKGIAVFADDYVNPSCAPYPVSFSFTIASIFSKSVLGTTDFFRINGAYLYPNVS